VINVMFARSYRRQSSSQSCFQSPAPRHRDRSRERHERSRDSRHSRFLDTRRQDRMQSSSKDTVHSRRWVTDTALILSPWSLLEVCQYGSLWHTGRSEKLQNVYQHFGFSCIEIYWIFWKNIVC